MRSVKIFIMVSAVAAALAVAGISSAADPGDACVICHSKKEITPWIVRTWQESSHAMKGIKCPTCHGNHDAGFDSPAFTAHPGPDKCAPCHPVRVKQTLAGKHGTGVKCSSCHPRHTFSLKVARNPLICATCHLKSAHVQEYRRSKMGVVHETMGANYSATCQTCHMTGNNHDVGETMQNKELMLAVCNRCHSASFAGNTLSAGEFRTHW